jgi:hypothetical protein
MKRNQGWLGVAVLLASALAGCGGTDNNGEDGGGQGLGDGHLQQGCAVDSDCDDGNKCHVPTCNVVSHLCMAMDKQCPAPDGCNVGVCDPSSGMCTSQAANDGMSCMSAQGQAGTCTTGFCQPVPTCRDPMNSFGTLGCSNFQAVDSNNNDPGGFGVTNAISSYGSCAKGEVAPEVSYTFTSAATTDQLVTVHLTPVSGGSPDAGAPADLDLIVIEGSQCISSAPCANPPLTGGGFQGITSGTSDERVTFTAKAGQSYFIVVDGKSSGSYHIEVEACGACQPVVADRLSCNQSVALAGDTSKGSPVLSSFTCQNPGGTGTTSFSAAGNEQLFFFQPTANAVQKVQAKVTGASLPVRLAAVPENSSTLACDPTMCLAGATASGGNATITFSANAAESFSGGNNYFIVVGSPMASMNTTFGLQLTCLPYCTSSSNLDCSSSKSGSANNGSGQSAVSAWGPAGAPCGGLSNLSGPEYVYLFSKPTTTKSLQRFTLVATTPGKHLALTILDAGTTSPASCDPATTCGNTKAITVAADSSTGTLASTGTYIAASPTTTEGGSSGKSAVVDLTSANEAHYYWVIVDGVNGDVSDFAISVDSGCN